MRLFRLLRRLAIGFLVLIICLAVAGAAYQLIASGRDARRYPAPGQMVDVGGFRMHLHCTGEGAPTVILLGGLGDNWTAWGRVQPRLSESLRVCSYDRAGLGHSDRGPTPRDADRQAEELETLLSNAGVEGPYIVAGHSLGGLYARVFAARNRDQLAGLVLLDPSHEDQKRRAAEVSGERNRPNPMDTMLLACRWLAPLGVVRLSGLTERQAIPEEVRPISTALANRTGLCRSVADEFAAFDEAAAQAAGSGGFGDVSMIVVTSGKKPDPGKMGKGMTPEAFDRMMKLMTELHLELAALSTRGRHVVAHESGHYIQLDQPDLVIDAFLEIAAPASGLSDVRQVSTGD